MPVHPAQARQFATEVVEQLRRHGHQALWAGGCVRDQLLGRIPNDYDVVTDARPEEVRRIFGRRRTIPVGAAFGVITVLGPPEAGQVEVATFRQEWGYSDGRHPDRVVYSTAEQDAQRRDFTINGLFYDPITEQVLDFVGGVEDLRRQVVRAIGDPDARIREDRLRMLRAVRIATIFDFAIDPGTLRAIQRHAAQIVSVSPERIWIEMQKILADRRRTRGMRLLRESGLLDHLLPEVAGPAASDPDAWEQMLRTLDSLVSPDPVVGLAAVLAPWCSAEAVEAIARRWRLSNRQMQTVRWLLAGVDRAANAHRARWSEVQPLLADERAASLVDLAEGRERAAGRPLDGIRFCRERLLLPREQLDPPPLIDGRALLRAGMAAGPALGRILQQLRAAQLDGQITTRSEALQLAQRLAEQAT